MNGAVFLNVVMVLAGAVIFLAVWFFAGRLLSEHHWLRKWTIATVERRGFLENCSLGRYRIADMRARSANHCLFVTAM